MNVGKIKSSTDYQWFQFLANNRKISKKHLSNLRKQFALYGNITEVSPILVNSNGFIIDGQHRTVLCEEFGLPVFYKIADADKEITPAINSNSKPWQAMDYVNFFAAYKPEYKALKRFIDLNEISWSLASVLLYPSRATRMFPILKEGSIIVNEFVDQA
jgi:hypothetical protein